MAYDSTGQVDMPPVTDWVNDWDWLDPQWGPNAIDIWNSVREQCPVATTERYGRAFMPVTMAAVTAVANDTTNFSSIWVNVGRPDAPRSPAPPITSDPPDHHGHRRLLLPAFSPKKVAVMEDELRTFCRSLIAGLDGSDTADAAEQFSQHIPVHGICLLTGLPEEDADLFRDWIYRNFQLAPRDNAVRLQVMTEMTGYIDQLLRDRLDHPQDDMLTMIANATIDGEPVDWNLKLGYIRLLIVAGIDTTWSAIGSGLWHFAQHGDQVARLVAVPDDDMLWQTASEEVLRYYAPVTMARKVVGETEVAGCPVHPGDQMLLPFPAANHDPTAFEAPHEFRLDRAQNRHVAFGLGVHRCVGSNLARLELLVALQEWLRAFPRYELDTSRPTTWANGQVRGPRNIPVLLHR
ncbi:MAG: cytochrome P450 [Acidimicrobiales bacterium]|nr:cytochrome P450 [Acidimicrobiales bacterium]